MKRSEREAVAKELGREAVLLMETLGVRTVEKYRAILSDREAEEIKDKCLDAGLVLEQKLSNFKRGIK